MTQFNLQQHPAKVVNHNARCGCGWKDLCEANSRIVDEIREIVLPNKQPGNVVEAVRALASPPASAAGEAEVLAMVDRFLAWRFPEDFAPDGGISYTPLPRLPEWTHDTRPTGTNLLTAIQARAMLEYVLAAQGGSDG